MKTLKIILISLVTLFILTIVVAFVLVKTFNTNAYLPQIVQAASNASGKEVKIDKAELGLSLEGIALNVFNVRINDPVPDPKLSISVDKVHARLELKPLIAKRKIQISTIVVTGIKVKMADDKAPLNLEIPNLEANVSDFSLTEPFMLTADLTFASAGNNVHIETNMRIDAAAQKADLTNLTIQTNLAQLNVNSLRAITPSLAQAPLPESLGGKAMLVMPHLSAGANAPVDIKADGEFNIIDGRLEKLNLLKTVLGRINFIPGMGDQISGMISEKFKNKLGGDNTTLDKVVVKFTVAGGQVNISDALVQSTNVFEVKAKGTAGFDGTVGVDVSMYIAPDISATLAKSIPPMQGLIDTDQRVYIPGRVSGKAPNIGYAPDMSYVGKKMATSESADQLGTQLDKVMAKNPQIKSILSSVFGNDGQSTNTGEGTTQPQETDGKKIINNVFNKMFK